ncbi:hypothetical protein [Cellulomonas shaoxiangyii]|uniref:DNA-binding protein n=1 Tax=Cellulomonas shaoxiangyii TaxID=2566013 RepID=A0A4V1CMP2_9CELL|nr:hypothetical protein [Cellulomonas shaoxiangyii]QCB93635.1 hypothetical protein E5225_08730 [Cellulomonas shaoxiangyii]TGY84622.1 hypothetical protein E5226_10460 [Cellulomonas shaoxiangyii]
MFVLTVDQRGSRRGTDLVPELLAHLADAPHLVRGFERTVGDEVQGVLADADAVVDLVLDLVRLGGWSVGVGAGPVVEPLPASPRAGAGEAFVLARAAVDAAKSRQRPVPLAVRGAGTVAAGDAEAVLTLLAAVLVRRTPAGWDAVDAVRAGAGQDVVAHGLGVTQQAVSQRLRAALWAEEQAVRPVAARLLTAAQA